MRGLVPVALGGDPWGLVSKAMQTLKTFQFSIEQEVALRHNPVKNDVGSIISDQAF